MERRRRKSPDRLTTNTEQLVKAYSAIVNRANLAGKLGTMTYSGERDLYQALGYPVELTFKSHYLPKYQRHDLAKAVIDRPVRAAWRGGLSIRNKDSKGEPNTMQDKWEELDKKHSLQSKLNRVDKLTGIGRYGVLLLGLNDVKKQEDMALPVTSKSNKLNYIKPLSEGSAEIVQWETDTSKERFGKPLMYSITIEAGGPNFATSFNVHYSRLIHIVDDVMEDDVCGTPRLQAVFNRLLDLDKIIGGDGEMFWRGARPGYHGKVDPDAQLTPSSEKGIEDQFDEFENNLRRFLLLDGVDVKSLEQQISDPSKHVDVQIQMVSAVTGIPKRILMGSERGELSSSQDREEWNLWVQTRREEFMEPNIVRPVVDRFKELGILPKEDYIIHWDELFAMSPTEKSEIAERLANAIRYYTATPTAEYILPKRIFLRKLLGLTEEELLEAEKLVDELPELELPVSPEEQAAMDEDSPVGSPVSGKNPMNGTGEDTVAKKQKAQG